MAEIPSPVYNEAIGLLSRTLMSENPALADGLGELLAGTKGAEAVRLIRNTNVGAQNIPWKEIISPTRAQQVFEEIRPPGKMYLPQHFEGLLAKGVPADLGVTATLPDSIRNSTDAEIRRMGFIAKLTGNDPGIYTQLQGADPVFKARALGILSPDYMFGGPLWQKSLEAAESGRVGKMLAALKHNHWLNFDLSKDPKGTYDLLNRYKVPLLAIGGALVGGSVAPTQAEAMDFGALRKLPTVKLLENPSFAYMWEKFSQEGGETIYRLSPEEVLNKWEDIATRIKGSNADPIVLTTPRSEYVGRQFSETVEEGQWYDYQVHHPEVPELPISEGEIFVDQDGIARYMNIRGIGPDTVGPRGVKKVLMQFAHQLDLKGIEDTGRITGVASKMIGGRTAKIALGGAAAALTLQSMSPDEAKAMPNKPQRIKTLLQEVIKAYEGSQFGAVTPSMQENVFHTTSGSAAEQIMKSGSVKPLRELVGAEEVAGERFPLTYDSALGEEQRKKYIDEVGRFVWMSPSHAVSATEAAAGSDLTMVFNLRGHARRMMTVDKDHIIHQGPVEVSRLRGVIVNDLTPDVVDFLKAHPEVKILHPDSQDAFDKYSAEVLAKGGMSPVEIRQYLDSLTTRGFPTIAEIETAVGRKGGEPAPKYDFGGMEYPEGPDWKIVDVTPPEEALGKETKVVETAAGQNMTMDQVRANWIQQDISKPFDLGNPGSQIQLSRVLRYVDKPYAESGGYLKGGKINRPNLLQAAENVDTNLLPGGEVKIFDHPQVAKPVVDRLKQKGYELLEKRFVNPADEELPAEWLYRLKKPGTLAVAGAIGAAGFYGAGRASAEEMQDVGRAPAPGSNIENMRLAQREKVAKGEFAREPFLAPFDSQLVQEFAGLIDPEEDGIPTLRSLQQNPVYQQLPEEKQLQARKLLFDQFYTQNSDLVSLRQRDPDAYNRIRTQYIGLPLPGMGEKLIAAVGRGALGSIGLNDPHRNMVEQTLLGEPGWPEKIAETATQLAAFFPAMGAGRAVGVAMGIRKSLSEFATNATLFGIQEAAKTRADQKEVMMRLSEQTLARIPMDPTRVAELQAARKKGLAESFGEGFEMGALLDLGFKAGGFTVRKAYTVGKATIGELFHSHKVPSIEVLAGEVPKDSTVIPEMEGALRRGPDVLDPASDEIQKRLIDSPKLVVTGEDSDLMVFLKDGTQINPQELADGYYRAPLTRDGQGRFVKGSGGQKKVTWDMVGEIRGTQDHLNILFDHMGLSMRLADAPNVTVDIVGGQIRRIGAKWVLFESSTGKFQTFSNETDVYQAAKKLQLNLANLEGPALGKEASLNTGVNLYKEGEQVRSNGALPEHANFLGGAPPEGQPPDTVGLGMPGGERPALGASTAVGRYVAPRKRTMLRLERQTAQPVYTKLYEPMERAMLDVRRGEHPWLEVGESLVKGMTSKQREGYALAMQTAVGSDAEKTLIGEMGLDEAKLKLVRQYFDGLFNHVGAGDSAGYFQNVVPRIQLARSLKKAFPDKNLLPPSLQVFAPYIQMGKIPLWRANLDIRQLMVSHVKMGFFHKFAFPTYESTRALWDDKFMQSGVPRIVKSIAQNYMDDIMGKVSATDAALMQGLGSGIIKTQKFLKGKGLGGPPITAEEATSTFRNFYGWMFSLNYSSNLGLRPAAVARQFLQTEQTTAVRFGHRAVWGANGGVARLATKEGQDLVEKAGILVEEAPFQTEEGTPQIFGKIFRRADNIQRSIAGLTQDSLFMKHLPTYTKRGDWNTFVRKSGLEFYDPIIQAQLKDLVDGGELTAARLRVMREASEDTQFIYRRGNQPEAFRGVAGKVFGQYGIWPAYYGDFMTQMLRQGSLSGRMRQVARFAAVNAVLGKVFSGALGASAASWIWFQPLNFSGGPIFQIGTSMYQGAFGRGPERQLAQYRLMPRLTTPQGGKPSLGALGQFIPGHQAARDLYGVYQQLDKGDGVGALRELLGYPAEKP